MANDAGEDGGGGDPGNPGDRLAAARAKLSGMAVAASETERRSEIEERANRPDPLKKLGKGATIALALVIVGLSVTMIWGTIATYRNVTALPPPPAGAARVSQSGAEARAALEAALRDSGLSESDIDRVIDGDAATTETATGDEMTTETAMSSGVPAP